MAKLKTFIVESGFYELAVAASSMKAALAAWGMKHNAFHQGLAKATTDAKIVAATEARPGLVLRRPIGAKSEFKEKPDAVKAPPPAKGRRVPKAKRIDEKKVRAAERALAKAQAEHDARAKTLNTQLRRLQDRMDQEDRAWQFQNEKLQTALEKAKRPR
jgi:colicin import membrane protein